MSISGSGASVTLGEALTYAGAFSEAAGDTLALTGGTLTLTGADDAFSGGTVDGSKFLYTEGTTAVSGLTIGGTVEWENTNAVNESGGNVDAGRQYLRRRGDPLQHSEGDLRHSRQQRDRARRFDGVLYPQRRPV